jgi:predicted nucleic acid-binding protein
VRRAVLADAGPLYAAVDPNDMNHQRALRELEDLAHRQINVFISLSTLLETFSLLLRRLGRNVAMRWLSEIAAATLINPTPEDYRQATRKLAGFADQSITLFDATVATLAMRLELEVWTYNHHFDVMRIPVWR